MTIMKQIILKLIQSTSEIVKKPDQNNLSSFRVIADHLRASSFLIAEEFCCPMKVEVMYLEDYEKRDETFIFIRLQRTSFYNLFETLKMKCQAVIQN